MVRVEKKRPNRANKNRPSHPSANRAKTNQPTGDEALPGQAVKITVKRIGINGEGVGYYRKKAVFIPGALPNEVVRALVTEVYPKYIKAKLLKVEKKSSDRIEPSCPVFEQCGGCQLQHLSYRGQLRAKEELVREAFSRYTGNEKLPIKPIIGMEDPWNYRNKAQLQAQMSTNGIITGLYSPGSHKLVDIGNCPIQDPRINEAAAVVRSILNELGITAYNENKRKGTVKTVVIRVAAGTGELQITLVTQDRELPKQDELVKQITEKLPLTVTIAHNVNRSKTPLVFGEDTEIIWGKPNIRETLGNLNFDLSPRAFFQLNPKQTVKLYEEVKKAAALTGKEIVVDTYCGTGTIGMWLAPNAKEVRGIESIKDAVKDARTNAKRSGIKNIRFQQGLAEEVLTQWYKEGFRPDVIVVDPPRSGCDEKLLETIARIKPRRLVYVSCNPSTLAKDCNYLMKRKMRVVSVQPVDMFPQTAHVEAVARLEMK